MKNEKGSKMGDMNDNTTTGNEDFETTQSSNSSPETNQMDSIQDTNQDQNMDLNTSIIQEDSFEPIIQTVPTEPIKKKSHGKLIALLIVIAIILAGSITAYAKRSTLANTFALLTKSPTEYYSYIERKGLGNSIDKLTATYDKTLSDYTTKKAAGVAQDASIKLTVNPEFTSTLGLGDFKSIGATISSLSKEAKAKTTIGLSYNDSSVITLDTFMDVDTSDLYLQIPEISSAYLLFALKDLMEETGSTSSYNITSSEIQAFIDNDKLSPEVLNSLLNKYSSIIIKTIDNVKLDKNTVLTASDISSSFSKLTAELNQEDLYNMGMAILNEAKSDQELIDLCVSLEICTKEEFTLGVDAAIVELTNSKETMLNSAETVIMNVYVDKAGNIMGREFQSTVDEVVSSLGYYITNKANKFGFTSWYSEDNVNLVELTGSATHSKSGFTGNTDISYSQYNDMYSDYTTYSANIAFEDANLVENKGYMNGKYTITSDSLMGMEFVIDCTADQKQQQIVFNIMYGNLEAATLDILLKEGTFQDFDMPATTDQVYDALTDYTSYLSTADIDSYITKLEGTLGIDDLGSYIENIISGFMY